MIVISTLGQEGEITMKGSCLCGKIKYEIKTFEPDIANCFCSMCRKISGAAYATYGTVLKENLN